MKGIKATAIKPISMQKNRVLLAKINKNAQKRKNVLPTSLSPIIPPEPPSFIPNIPETLACQSDYEDFFRDYEDFSREHGAFPPGYEAFLPKWLLQLLKRDIDFDYPQNRLQIREMNHLMMVAKKRIDSLRIMELEKIRLEEKFSEIEIVPGQEYECFMFDPKGHNRDYYKNLHLSYRKNPKNKKPEILYPRIFYNKVPFIFQKTRLQQPFYCNTVVPKVSKTVQNPCDRVEQKRWEPVLRPCVYQRRRDEKKRNLLRKKERNNKYIY